MIHRIQINGLTREAQSLVQLIRMLGGNLNEANFPAERRLQGIHSSPQLCTLMSSMQLPSPEITNPRVRFFFTDEGWHEYGAALLHHARQMGYTAIYYRRGDPNPSQIAYQDRWQVAILPDKTARTK